MGCSCLHARLGPTFPTSNALNVRPWRRESSSQLLGWAAVVAHELLLFN